MRRTAFVVSLLMLAGCRSYQATTTDGAKYSAFVFASDTSLGTLRYVNPETGAELEVGELQVDADTEAIAAIIGAAYEAGKRAALGMP